MKAVQLIEYGSVDSITISDIEIPKPNRGEIVVRVHASGVNPFDWKIVNGDYQKIVPLNLPKIIGLDFSGSIRDLGGEAVEFKVGDEVFGQVNFTGGSGSFAEYALTQPAWIARKPKNLSHIESAALPLSGVSAIQALNENMNIKRGEKVLIHGGAGGIGSLAIQIAKNIGAYVFTTTGKRDFEYVKSLGADKIIDYEKERFEEIVRNADYVFDTIGKDTFLRSFQVLKKGGLIVSMLEKVSVELSKKYDVKVISQFTKVTTERLNKLRELAERSIIKIHVDKIFPLFKSGEALSYLKSGKVKGKVVIKITNS